MKKVLITGATGFIGRHCIAQLLRLNYEVHAISEYPLIDYSSKVHWHTCNILNEKAVKNLISSIQPIDSLIHLAWFVEPQTYLTSHLNLLWVKASITLIEEFIKHNGRSILISGSCLEYNFNYKVCTEETTPIRLLSLYSASKISLYIMIRQLCTMHNVSLKWCRIFFLYGPHEKPKRLVPLAIQSLLENKIFVCKTGEDIRDYLHVEDVASALISVFQKPSTGVINIGSGTPTKIKDILEIIATVLNKKNLISFSKTKNNLSVVASINKLSNKIQWKPRYTLYEGLTNTINWWIENRKKIDLRNKNPRLHV